MSAAAQIEQFMPHGMCFLWNSHLLALHVVSDAVIALAYYSIPLVLLFFIRKRDDLPFRAVFAMFGIFIVACGTTHVLDIWTIWHPTYWIAGTVKALTATMSLATVLLLVRIVPVALALRSPARLDALNRQLTASADRDRATAAMLREKNRLMAMAEQMAHVGHWRLDLVSTDLYWSDEIYRTFGVPTTTIPTPAYALSAYHPDDRGHVTALLEKAATEGAPFTHESRVIRADGTTRHILCSGQSEYTPDGTVIAIFGVLRDVTEAKESACERELLIERVRVATQGARVGIWDWDFATGAIVWEPIMFELYGFEDTQCSPTYGMWVAALHADDRARVENEMARAAAGGGNVDTEFRVIWPQGEVHNIRALASVVRDEAKVAQRMIGTNWDVTEVRTLADQLQREKDAATFAAAHDLLTGLLNRRGIEAWIRSQTMLAGTLLYLDIDGFKNVNDRGGHAAGDDTLRLVGRIIGDAVREGDRAARIGGDEFLVVLPDVCDSDTTLNVVARITSAVESLRPLGAIDDTRIGMSIGVGHLADAAAFAEALREADADLYRRKSKRRSDAATAAASHRSSSGFGETSFRVARLRNKMLPAGHTGKPLAYGDVRRT